MDQYYPSQIMALTYFRLKLNEVNEGESAPMTFLLWRVIGYVNLRIYMGKDISKDFGSKKIFGLVQGPSKLKKRNFHQLANVGKSQTFKNFSVAEQKWP